MTITRARTEPANLAEQEQAWDEYAAAAMKAQETLAVSDGIAAAKAWAHFLKLFLDREADAAA